MGMIDISNKKIVSRTAIAEGQLILHDETIKAIRKGNIKKGDPLKTAEASALLAIKKTFVQIPHCHPIPVSFSEIKFIVEDDKIICQCTVKADYKTGVEIEALNGVFNALLTVLDMVKYLEKDKQGQYKKARIQKIRVVKKQKGE